ncbi:MAG: hypothetical protein PHT41_04575 [Candidatus Omnitrophica bacterium]|nr:hypothetical protein [Candidatus Omnitrophota bacterium]
MKNKGVTFVEIFIVVLIMTVITAMLLSAFIQSRALFQTADIPAIQQAAIRKIMGSIALDLNQTAYSQIQITQDYPFAGSDMLRYRLPQYSGGSPVLSGLDIVWDSDIFINLDSSKPGRLIKTQGGNVTVLGEHFNKINFFDQSKEPMLSQNELKITLNLRHMSTQQRIYDMSAAAILNMRN